MSQMNSFTQSVDITVNLSSDSGHPFPNELSVISAEIERVFGGGGSVAEIEVVFDELLTSEQKEAIESRVSPEEEGIPGDNSDDGTTFTYEQNRSHWDLTMSVDIEIIDSFSQARTGKYRIFTGTVTKVVENNERVVTFSAMDRRFQLNRNSAFVDVGEDGQPVREIVKNVLRDTGFLQEDDFQVTLGGEDPIMVYNQSWGVSSHTTVYQLLQDLARVRGATIHIDRHNVIHFTMFPPHMEWIPGHEGVTHNQIPPIVEWESGSEESSTEVIVESEYNETGHGFSSPINEDVLESTVESGAVSKRLKENNVISRDALESVSEFEYVSDSLMRDSGTIRFVGDPRIEPYDEFQLDSDTINGFAPISQGNYISKTSRHIISDQDGYIVEVELGDDPQELFDDFTRVNGTRIDVREATEPPGDDVGFLEEVFYRTASSPNTSTDIR